jgi:ubiquinol-cytochrome c reductase cytochrome b subunit
MSTEANKRTWTEGVREAAVRALPPEQLLPERQPVFVSSWLYVFGALTIAAFVLVLISGLWLSLEGPTWWHTSTVGLFVNSLHLWSTELFFFFMVIHLWAPSGWRPGGADAS